MKHKMLLRWLSVKSEQCCLLYRHRQDFVNECDSRFTVMMGNETVLLHLTGLTAEDSGRYTCECIKPDGTFSLHVNVPVKGNSLCSLFKSTTLWLNLYSFKWMNLCFKYVWYDNAVHDVCLIYRWCQSEKIKSERLQPKWLIPFIWLVWCCRHHNKWSYLSTKWRVNGEIIFDCNGIKAHYTILIDAFC